MPSARAILWIAVGLITAAAAGRLAAISGESYDAIPPVLPLSLWWACTAGCASIGIIAPGWRRIVGLSGLVAAIAFLASTLVTIHAEWPLKVFATSAALGHIAVLLPIDVRRGPGRVARLPCMAATVALAGIAMSEWMNWRAASLTWYPAIILLWGMLCLPLLLWLERVGGGPTTRGRPLAGQCPRCGHDQMLRLGTSTCERCGLRVRIARRASL